MDIAGLKNISGTLQLMGEALTSHIEDATKEADRLRESIDRDNSRDGNLTLALERVVTLEDAEHLIRRAAQFISSVLGDS